MLKTGVISAGLVLAIALLSLTLNADLSSRAEASLSCQCEQNLTYDPSLPASHPSNLCATGAHQNTTWLGWLQGNSRSTEFHFLDLLELIWQPSETANQKHPQPSSS